MTPPHPGHGTGLRLLGLVAILALALIACDGGDTIPTTSTPATVAPPSTTAPPPTQAPLPPAANITDRAPSRTLPQVTAPLPELPDPDEMAEAALPELPGFTYTGDVTRPELLDELDLALGPLPDDVVAGLSWSGVVRDADGDALVAFAAVPSIDLRGDPTLPPGIAGAFGGFLDEPTAVEIEGGVAWRTSTAEDRDWLVTGTNTIIIGVGGDPDAAVELLERLVAARLPEYLWQAGDCLFAPGGAAPFAPYGEDLVVPCDGPHTFEVVHTEIVPEGPSDPYPDDLAERRTDTCLETFRDYVGIFEFDAWSELIYYMPDADEWFEGDRYLGCVLFTPDLDANAAVVTGSRRDAGAEDLRNRAVGDCHRSWPTSTPLPCRRAHEFEYLGALESSRVVFDVDALWEEAAQRCPALLDGVTDPLNPEADVTVETLWLIPGRPEWQAGVRRFECFAQVVDPAGNPQLIVGSVTGGWRVVAEAGGGISA